MPGIFGIVDLNDKLGADTIKESLRLMSESLRHENLHRAHDYIEKTIGVSAVCRKHDRPFPCIPRPKRSGSALMFYGDIYSFDGEDVLGDNYLEKLYYALQVDVEKTVKTIDGNFIFAFYNDTTRKLYIVNDLTSSVPLYYTYARGTLCFAPEIKALLQLPFVEKQADLESVSHFLSSGMVYLDKTLFKNVHALSPSSIYCVDLTTKKMTNSEYWSFTYNERTKDRGTSYYSTKLADLINRAVKRRTRDRETKKIGSFLSGGFDSRTILGACLKNNVNIETITHGVNRDKPQSDALVAKKLSDHLGLQNHFYTIKPEGIKANLEKIVYLTDGLTDQVGNYPDGLDNYRQIGTDFDVVLRGEEIFGWMGGVFNEGHALASFQMIPLPKRFKTILGNENYASMAGHATSGLNLLSSSCTLKNLVNRKDFFVFRQGIPNFWGKLNYLKSIAVDIRNPLLDKEIIEFIMNLPPGYRFYRKLFRLSTVSNFHDVFDLEMSKVSNLPNWKESYQKNSDIRNYVRSNLTDTPNIFFKKMTDENGLKQFLSNYERSTTDLVKLQKQMSSKQYQTTKGINKYLKTNIRTSLAHLIKSNYPVYRMALPFFQNMKTSDSWLKDNIIIMRLLVTSIWSRMFL